MVKKYVLPGITAFLIVLYGFSFLIKAGQSSEKSTLSALINPSNKKDITYINFFGNHQEFTLKKSGEIWTGTVCFDDIEMDFPVDQDKVNSFIEDFSDLRKVYLVSKNTANSDFGLENGFEISYKGKNDLDHKLFFGNSDFSGTKRYFSNESSKAVFKTDSSLDRFLLADFKLWTDPLIIPQNLHGKITPEDIERIVLSQNGQGKTLVYKNQSDKEKINKLLELRHGNLESEKADGTPDYTLSVYLNNGRSIKINVSQKEDSDYLLSYFLPELNNYNVSISSWTFNKLLDQFK